MKSVVCAVTKGGHWLGASSLRSTDSCRVFFSTEESTCSDLIHFLSQGKEELEVEFTMESR